jgi:hypothetical protein
MAQDLARRCQDRRGLDIAGSIAPIFKRVAQWIGMLARFVAEVSGHSTRAGAAQDLAALARPSKAKRAWKPMQ